MTSPIVAGADGLSQARILWIRRYRGDPEVLDCELYEAFTRADGQHIDRRGYVDFCRALRDADVDPADGIVQIDPLLIDGLWEIQRYYRSIGIVRPIDVYDGFRTPRTNASIEGAAPNSQHLYAKAADIGIDGVPMRHLYEVANAITFFGGIGYYSTHIHVDTGPAGRRW